MSPEQIKNINARCEEYRWLTEREEVINALAYQIAGTDEAITFKLEFGEPQKDDMPRYVATWEEIRNRFTGNPITKKLQPSYVGELTDVETLEILGILLRRVMDKRKALKEFLTENGVTF